MGHVNSSFEDTYSKIGKLKRAKEWLRIINLMRDIDPNFPVIVGMDFAAATQKIRDDISKIHIPIAPIPDDNTDGDGAPVLRSLHELSDILMGGVPDNVDEPDEKPKPKRKYTRKAKLVPEPEPELDPDRFWKATQDISKGL